MVEKGEKLGIPVTSEMAQKALLGRRGEHKRVVPHLGASVLAFTNLAETNYYAFSLKCVAAGAPQVITFTGNIDLVNLGANSDMIWCQRPLPYLDDVLETIRAIRITGVSCMYTNTSAMISRQGQCVGLQLPKGANWLNNYDFNSLAVDKKSQTLPIQNGMYGFLKPTLESDFDMKPYFFESYNDSDRDDFVYEMIVTGKPYIPF